MTRHVMSALAVGALAVGFARAQVNPPLEMQEPQDQQTIGEYGEAIDKWFPTWLQDKASRSRVVEEWAHRPSEDLTLNAESVVADKTTSVDAPNGFAGRVTNALTDFLPIFQGAVNGVGSSDDKKSVTVSFNPWRWGWGELNFKGTIAEPQPFGKLLDAVVDSARATQKDALAKMLSDFDDMVFAASIGLRGRNDRWSNPRPRLMLGRNSRDYQDLIAGLVGGKLDRSLDANRLTVDSPELALLLGKLKSGSDRKKRPPVASNDCDDSDPDKLSFDCARRIGGWTDADIANYRKALWALKINEKATAEDVARSGLATLIPALIDNQPQVVLTVSRTRRDRFVGQDEETAAFSWEFGATNFNSVIREFRYLVANNRGVPSNSLALTAFENVVSDKADAILKQDRFVVSVTYKRSDALAYTYAYTEQVASPAGGNPVSVARTSVLSLPSTWEISGTFQWGRILDSDVKAPNVPRPRVDVSINYLKVSDTDVRQSRVIARASLTYPISDVLSLPLSISYANRAEFLGDQDKTFSAHIGVTYKFKRKPAN